MDSLTAAAARALASGDALAALRHVALREDPPALALRGVALAQLQDWPRARELLQRAARAFGPQEALAQARCVVADAEVALALRELGGSSRPLRAAAATLAARGDGTNALQAWLVLARREVLLGRLADARAALDHLDGQPLPAPLAAMAELTHAEVALRTLQVAAARAALQRAGEAAAHARIAALQGEVERAWHTLDTPAARCRRGGQWQALTLDGVAALWDADALVVDACRRGVHAGATGRSLARRPVLFALLRALAEAWPGDAGRDALIGRAFGMRHPDDTHRARLRVEIGRLRALLQPWARVDATAAGFVLLPAAAREVVVLAPPRDDAQDALLALLSDGAGWASSALALALGTSQRSVQRALAELEGAGRVRAVGQGRTQRWLAPPLTGFTTILLLPATLPID
ncbi:MAG TPA: helix-turn-helix domain-containing protein [Stenotrophomonas sp.]|jgi:hypothetical protein|uniref:helix-turn-helix domain-containing protein n=1 Tax=unclassified Stenotrophomonas TaxID=196198 RepID=UPI000E92D312|nr:MULTISPECIES: helix-turn-helix domain-containing protein [unclassified Stenotrophomonas]HBS61273.1 helix-turn-helix domain-containing protein [Stenotrophomonas sp.]